ncbi:MAG: sulfatase-like hydrolase/transferase [Pseudomonadota bacterium]
MGAIAAPPSAEIRRPDDATSVASGEGITFVGRATDPEDGNIRRQLVWTSSVAGNLFTGNRANRLVLADGVHVITATVTDSEGLSASDSVTVTVGDPVDPPDENQPPTIDVSAGSNTVDEGDAVTLTATTADAEDGAPDNVSWASSLDGPLGNGLSLSVSLSTGEHVITATVTDSGGASASASLTINVTAGGATGEPPTLAISGPADNSTIASGARIRLRARAIDPETGNIRRFVQWNSDIDGDLFVGGAANVNPSDGVHTITATVTDNGGWTVSDSITLTVGDPIVEPPDPPEPPNPSAQPNILIVIADDIGAEASSLYPTLAGDTGQVAMPSLEALAETGVVFDAAWSNPVCTPTRGNILSGQHGHQTDVLAVGDDLDPDTTTSIFEYLAADAPMPYAMAAFGKWHLGGTSQTTLEHGIPLFRGSLGGAVSDYFDWTIVSTDRADEDTSVYATTAQTDFAIDFIGSQTNPWFVYLAYNAPHSSSSGGFQVPPSALHSVDVGNLQPGDTQSSTAVYQAMVQALDTELGRLLAAVDLDNTIVIFLGDNGTPAAVQDSGVGLSGRKGNVLEGGVRVPFVVGGAVSRRGERESKPITATDIYATVAAYAGISVSQIGDSFSLVPLLNSTTADDGDYARTHAFTEFCNNNDHWAIRDQRYKLMSTRGAVSLFDLVADPQESNNRHNDPNLASEQLSLETQLAQLAGSAPHGCFP